MAGKRRSPSGRRSPPPDRGALYPTLDLHGETAAAARRRVRMWLHEQRDAGERLVRIITGRGRHSIGPPVLRAEMEDLLRELTGSLVHSVESEAGGGALRVMLRAAYSVTVEPRSRPGIIPADPALRREAEEALVALGVTPTPELLNAEIRRLRAARRDGPPESVPS